MRIGRRVNEGGAMTIVEAAFVFPITIIVVLLMIMVGEAYFQRSRVEYEVSHAAISGAARCENPMLSYIQKNSNSVPKGTSDAKVIPYRYIFTGNAKTIGDDVAEDLRSTIDSMKPLMFRFMKPTNVSVKVEPRLNVLVSAIKVDCEFDIKLPIRMIFSKENFKLHYRISTYEPIGDPAEFVRNVSTVQDLIEKSKIASGIFGKVKAALDKVARFMT